jgi:hypothetical protein
LPDSADEVLTSGTAVRAADNRSGNQILALADFIGLITLIATVPPAGLVALSTRPVGL